MVFDLVVSLLWWKNDFVRDYEFRRHRVEWLDMVEVNRLSSVHGAVPLMSFTSLSIGPRLYQDW